MSSQLILYTTAALTALVAVACTALCLMWSIPSWRIRLGRRTGSIEEQQLVAGGLTGWAAQVGTVLISIGIAACALVAWCGMTNRWRLGAI